jgi:hypothetical protein
MLGINAEHKYDPPSELSAPERQRRSPTVMDLPVRESIILIGRTKRSKRSRHGEMMMSAALTRPGVRR